MAKETPEGAGDKKPRSELDELLGSEAEKLAKERKEAPERLAKIDKTETLLVSLIGWGLADEMPFDEVLGFLIDREDGTKKQKHHDGPTHSAGEIRAAREFLESCISPDAVGEKTPLGSVLDYLKNEKERIEEIIGIEP